MDYPTSVELDRLRAVGNIHLPQMVLDIHATVDGLRTAAEEEDSFEGGLFANTAQRWFEACKDLEDILWYTEDALRDAARAIIQVADAYAWTDSATAIHLDDVDGS
jgi:hypothetical protein